MNHECLWGVAITGLGIQVILVTHSMAWLAPKALERTIAISALVERAKAAKIAIVSAALAAEIRGAARP
jgi:hypothetical protein